MTNTQVFNLSTVGIYPYERYIFTPVTFTVGNLPTDFTSIFWNQLDGSGVALPLGGSLLTRNYLNYHKNPMNQVLNYLNPYYNTFVYYNNVTYTRYSDKFIVSLTAPVTGNRYIEKVPVITLNNALNNYSSITFDISAVRQNFKTPYEFYFFYVQLNDTTKNSYGYMMYPHKVFLNPKSITNNNNKWQLKTSVNLLSGTIVHIQSTEIEKDALTLHQNRLKSLPSNVINLTENLNNNKIYFELYGSQTSINNSVISPSSISLAPSFSSINLGASLAHVNEDTTFVTFSSIYTTSDGLISNISQASKNDSYLYNSQKFNPTFILDYNPTTNNVQNYQLIQSLIYPSFQLLYSQNTVLSANFDLNSGLFNFYNLHLPANAKFLPNAPLKINYIADYYNLTTASVLASSTLTNQELDIYDGVTLIGSQSILSPFLVNNISARDIVWETDYPPYCYSYKLKLKNSSENYLDSYGLNFYLKLSAIYQDSNFIKLSAFIVSDFEALKVPINYSDLIKFNLESTSLDDDTLFLDSIYCSYGDDFSQTQYILKDSPYIPVSNGKYLTISLQNTNYQGITFSLKGSLITSSGQLDSYETLDIDLNPPSTATGNKIFIDVINEQSNEISIDSSFNVTTENWPSRDLRDSKIKWFYSGGNNLSLNYIDQYGNFISKVTGEDVFSDKTWNVKLSGYGPILTSISLSSQKYNEVATLSTNPNLYDFLSQGKIKVGVAKPLDNLNITRTIELTAAIPYGDKLFNIPSNIPISWTWEYDGVQDPTLQPISVQQLSDNVDYTYGVDIISTTVSAIKINVTPEFSKTSPRTHDVKLIANINSVQPSITGSYQFKVDDFPDPSIFNCDFVSYYTNFQNDPKYQIADTRNKENTITRSEQSVLNFTFSSIRDIFNNIAGGNLYWFYGNNRIYNNDNQYVYNIELTNPLSALSVKNINGLSVSSIDINLVLNSAYAQGWTSAHNVSATTNIYILSSVDFYKPLKFIIYPEYAWLPDIDGDYTKLTLLEPDPNSSNYFTYAYAPTAYLHKKSDSQTFWLSANKTYFNEYIYQNKQNFTIVSSPSAYDLLDIKYTVFDVSIIQGLPISLIAYNQTFYPENINVEYIDEIYQWSRFIPEDKRLGTTDISYFATQYYNITAKTTETAFLSSNVYNNFFISPKFKLYDDVLLEYIPYCNNEIVSSINLDLSAGANISIKQTLNTIPPKMPALIVGGTITYYLSTRFWTASSEVLANPLNVNTNPISTYHENLFSLQYGDPSVPLYLGELGTETIKVYATQKLIQQIPPTTFDNYLDTIQYPKDPDLWKKIDL
jgi:hypothetical protein